MFALVAGTQCGEHQGVVIAAELEVFLRGEVACGVRSDVQLVAAGAGNRQPCTGRECVGAPQTNTFSVVAMRRGPCDYDNATKQNLKTLQITDFLSPVAIWAHSLFSILVD